MTSVAAIAMFCLMPGLIITNGDSAAELLREAGRSEPILPWRDVLHEGPIVAGPLEACSRRRGAFLAERFRLDEAEVAAEFAGRDELVLRHTEFDRIELWFEHDLYDQLQLVQVLSFFADEDRTAGLLLVQADEFLGRERPQTILRFAERARPIEEDDLDLADVTWSDLAMPTPEAVAAHPRTAIAGLAFLGPALNRFLEELPAPGTGLGRTEATALDLIAAGTPGAVDVFRQAIDREEAAFMGDLSFFRLLDDLAFAEIPLIAGLSPPGTDDDIGRFETASLELTEAGEAVLAGEADHVVLSGIDRWWAGTRLLGHDVWRYDRDATRLVPPHGVRA
jgi:Domain of unknown function (DUF1835)